MKELTGKMRIPRKAKPLGVTDEGWWYIGPRSIDVFGRNEHGGTTAVRITRRQLKAALKIMAIG